MLDHPLIPVDVGGVSYDPWQARFLSSKLSWSHKPHEQPCFPSVLNVRCVCIESRESCCNNVVQQSQLSDGTAELQHCPGNWRGVLIRFLVTHLGLLRAKICVINLLIRVNYLIEKRGLEARRNFQWAEEERPPHSAYRWGRDQFLSTVIGKLESWTAKKLAF